MEKNYQKKLDTIIQSYEVDVENGLTKARQTTA